MNSLQNITFANPELLFLLLLLPVLGYWYWRKRRGYYPKLSFSSLEAVQGFFSWRGALRNMLPLLRGLALAALVVALARPQQVFQEEVVKGEGIDIMLAMDLSASMLAQDFKPNRLAASKEVAKEFVDKRAYDRVGLAVFAAESYTPCPLTTDHEVLKEYIDAMECGLLKDGTAVGMGLATAVNRLKNSTSTSKIIILLTDGKNNTGYIEPLTAAQIAKELDIKVYTIGVGTGREVLVPIMKDPKGNYVPGIRRIEIDEGLLKDIASITGGQYYRATSEAYLSKIYEEIDRLEKSEIDITVFRRRSEAFHPFALFALILLGLEATLRYGIVRSLPL